MSASINTIPASYFVDVIPGVISAGPSGENLIELMLTTKVGYVPIGAVYSFPNATAVANFFGSGGAEAQAASVYFNGYTGGTLQPSSLLFATYPLTAVSGYLQGAAFVNKTIAYLNSLQGVLTVSIDGNAYTTGTINLSSYTTYEDAAAYIGGQIIVAGYSPPSQAVVTATMGSTFTATASGSPATILTVTSVTGYISVGDTITGTGVTGTVTIASQISGTTGAAGVYTTSAATTCSSASITAVSNYLDVTAVSSGIVITGLQPTGSNFSANPPLFVTALGTGTGTTGTYFISGPTTTTASAQKHFTSETVTFINPVCGFFVGQYFAIQSGSTGATSSVSFASGSLAAGLLLTQQTGALVSPGSAAGVPGTFMTGVTAVTTNWATFQTLFDPDNGSGNAQKQLFAAWTNSTNNQYAYLAWDHDITPTQSTAATSSLGYLLNSTNSSGTVPIYEPTGSNLHLAAFVGGFAASVDFNATNGRATAAYKSQSGLSPSVTSATVAANLQANGYNFYGAVATAGANWEFFYPGSITGPFAWFDSYINQIWLNNQCQITLMTLLTSLGRVPYNPAGYAQIRGALTGGANGQSITLPPASPVAAGLNNGVITPNVPLSAEQAIVVNNLAGFPIDQILSTQGWYLIIQPATAATRAARKSPTVILLYSDGGSIQQINLSSLLVQ